MALLVITTLLSNTVGLQWVDRATQATILWWTELSPEATGAQNWALITRFVPPHVSRSLGLKSEFLSPPEKPWGHLANCLNFIIATNLFGRPD